MHAFVLCAQVLLSSLLPAVDVWAVHKSVAAVLVDMGLNMTSWDDLVASFSFKRTLYPYIITHIDQESRDVEEYTSRRGSAGRASELVPTGGEGSDRGVETFLTEDMVALQSNWTYVGAMTYCTHEMVVITGDVFQGAEVDNPV